MNPEPEYEQVHYAIDPDGLATLTLNRPAKLNAWTPKMHDEVLDVLDRVDADDDVRVLIVTGAGRGFCAGADLRGGASTWDAESEERRALRVKRGTIDGYPREGGALVTVRILRLTKPTIAAINGPAVGIGASLTLPMDMRLASENARIGFVFARRGVVPDAASSWLLPRVVGIARALEWAMTGRLFDAEEALVGGLVSRVVPPGELLATARALGEEIARSTAPVSVALTRELLWRGMASSSPWDAHRLESKGYALLGGRPDATEGVEAALAKRDPAFPGRVSTDLPALADAPWPPEPEGVDR